MRTPLFRALSFFLLSVSLPAQNLHFLARQDYGSANNGDLVLGDFDEDGILDMATDVTLPGAGAATATATASICIYTGIGDGTFRPGPCTAPPMNGRVFAVADLNGDHHLDIAFLAGDGTIYTALGTGAGTFLTFTPVATGSGLRPILVDLNADGKPDLVIPSLSPGASVEVLLGNANGTFQSPVVYPVGNTANAIAVNDFNHDGKLDLAVGTDSTGGLSLAVAVLLGNGNGTFQPALFSQAPHSVVAITSADYNQDGTVDLMVGYGNAAPGVNLLLGAGDGTFRSGPSFATDNALSLDTGDVNGDTMPDVAVTGGAHTASILLNQGRGNFHSPANYTVGNAPDVIRLADLRGVGKLDFVTANTADSLSVLLNQGAGLYNDGVAIKVSSSAAPSRAGVLRDFNRDSVADLAVTTASGVQILLGTGNAAAPYSTGPAYAVSGPSSITAGDFNSDGAADLAVGDSSGMIHILLGNGDGSFHPGATVDAGSPALTLVTADFNGDRNLDLATDGGVVLLGNGDGTFQPYGRVLRIKSLGLAVADLNGDKVPDLVFAVAASGGGLVLLPGNGDGTFKSSSFLPLGGTPRSVLAADLNGDGVVDLAVPAANGILYLIFNGGGGSFTTQTITEPFWSELDSVTTGNFNRDKIPDLAVTNTTNNSVTILDGTGQGAYAYRGELGTNPGPSLILGNRNLVTLNSEGTITALANQNQ